MNTLITRNKLIELANQISLENKDETFDSFISRFHEKLRRLREDNPSLLKYDWGLIPFMRWLFNRESVVTSSISVNFYKPFKCCYGNGNEAICMFKHMLNDVELSPIDKYNFIHTDRPDHHIRRIVQRLKNPSFVLSIAQVKALETSFWYDESSKDYYPVSDEIIELLGDIDNTYEGIVPIISRLIKEPFKELWVKIHDEHIFSCVRYCYLTVDEKWIENTELYEDSNHYRNLTIIHGYSKLVREDRGERNDSKIVTLHLKNGIIDKHIEILSKPPSWHDDENYIPFYRNQLKTQILGK